MDKPGWTYEPLRVGLIADAEGVQRMAPALGGPVLDLVAQSGHQQAEGVPDVQWYDDNRVMLAQAGLEALILATSTRAGIEQAEMAADHQVPVWRLPPLARNFDQATEFVTRLRRNGVHCRVASWWEMVAIDVHWAVQHGEGFKPVFTHLRNSSAGPSVKSWRASLVDAPGGVLATDTYDLLEALVGLRNLPEQVSATVANVRRRPGEAPRETEDVANAILRYESGGTAVVHATWDMPPFGWVLEHHGAELSITLDHQQVEVRAADGEVLAQRPRSSDDFLRWELERFAAGIRNPAERDRQDEAMERHIAVTALLQAIYLSAQTGQPESPLKFYEVQGWPEPRW